jgi:hypothetical protein
VSLSSQFDTDPALATHWAGPGGGRVVLHGDDWVIEPLADEPLSDQPPGSAEPS